MKRRVLSVLLTVAMVLTMSACGLKEPEVPATETKEEVSEAKEEAPKAEVKERQQLSLK